MGSMTEYIHRIEAPAPPPPKRKPRMTEDMLQRLVYQRNNHKTTFCNVFIGNNTNEWDVLTISDAGYATGYEIKLSKSDLKADLKKPRHELLLNRELQGSQPRGEYFRRVYRLGLPIKYFWYVCAEFKVTAEDVPEYAGLMVAGKFGLEILKPAPRLWNEKVKDTVLPRLYENIAKRLMYNRWERIWKKSQKYWDDLRAWERHKDMLKDKSRNNSESSHKT